MSFYLYNDYQSGFTVESWCIWFLQLICAVQFNDQSPLQLYLKRNYSFLEGIMLKFNNQTDSVVRLLGLSSIADTVTCYLTINKISFTLVFQFNFHCCDKRHSPENTSR